MPFAKIAKIRLDLARGDSVALHMHCIEMSRWLGGTGIADLLEISSRCYQTDSIEPNSAKAVEEHLRLIGEVFKPGLSE